MVERSSDEVELGADELELGADYLELRRIGPWLAEVLDRNGHAEHDARGTIELAVHELATNSVDHAQSPDGLLRLHASCPGERLIVRLSDRGVPVDLGAIDVPDEPQVRGYGMMIVEQVASDLRYERADGVNLWTATFAL